MTRDPKGAANASWADEIAKWRASPMLDDTFRASARQLVADGLVGPHDLHELAAWLRGGAPVAPATGVARLLTAAGEIDLDAGRALLRLAEGPHWPALGAVAAEALALGVAYEEAAAVFRKLLPTAVPEFMLLVWWFRGECGLSEAEPLFDEAARLWPPSVRHIRRGGLPLVPKASSMMTVTDHYVRHVVAAGLEGSTRRAVRPAGP